MIDSSSEIVITGVGAASPIGIGYDAFLQSLDQGTSGVRRLRVFDSPEFPVRVGAEVVGFDPKLHVAARKNLKVMSRSIQLAFASAQLAVAQARLSSSGVDPERFGVVFGADMMQLEPNELVDAFRPCVAEGKFDYAQWDERTMGEMFPLWMLKYLPNMPACHVAIAHDARGPNNTIVLGDASSLLAIAEGMRVIQRGATDVMIVGGTGSRIHPMTWAFRDNIQLCSPRTEQPEEVSRPFDAGHDGMVYGEGAAAYVLESRASRPKPAERGSSPASSASRNTFEACTPGKTFPGQAIRSAIRRALAEAEMQPADIGHVNAHGLSTRLHDRAEADAIRDTLGDVPVTALKSYLRQSGCWVRCGGNVGHDRSPSKRAACLGR